MNNPNAILIIDLAYGDCGKGTTVDHLTRRHAAHTVVRFNGGPQAAHNVVTPDGRHHTFAQFGAGTFVPNVRTLLSRFVLFEPYALFNEAAHLATVGVPNALDRLSIDARCLVITPFHQAANRLRELARGDAAHGTCGLGIGETMQDHLDRPELSLRAADLSDAHKVATTLRNVRDHKLAQLRDVIAAAKSHPKSKFDLQTLLEPTWVPAAVETYATLARRARIVTPDAANAILRADGTVIFEAAQGVLLDEWFGYHPHTTWSTTTFANADALLDDAHFPGDRTRLGVLRTYATRHGHGPLVTEDPAMRSATPEPHNADTGWQGAFRVGPFDAVASRYALQVAGRIDGLVLTHLDRLPHLPPKICTAYERRGDTIRDLRASPKTDLEYQERLTAALRDSSPRYTTSATDPAAFVDMIERQLSVTVRLTSHGPTATDKTWR